jgi:hypothetical protein
MGIAREQKPTILKFCQSEASFDASSRSTKAKPLLTDVK